MSEYYKITIAFQHDPLSEDSPENWVWSDLLDRNAIVLNDAEPLSEAEIEDLDLDESVVTCQNCDEDSAVTTRFVGHVEINVCETCANLVVEPNTFEEIS